MWCPVESADAERGVETPPQPMPQVHAQSSVPESAGRPSSDSHSPKKRRWVVVGFVVSALCLLLFARQLEREAWHQLSTDFDALPVLMGVSIFLTEFILRSLRWRLLLSPLGKARLRDLISITFISFTASNLLIARSGELVRPVLASQRFKLPLTPVIATTFMERLCDLVGLLSVFVVMTLTLPETMGPGVSPLFLTLLERVGRLGSVLGVVGVALFFFLAANEAVTRALVEKCVAWLPQRLQPGAMTLYDGLAKGLAAFRSWRTLVPALLLSGMIWINGALALWVMFQGVGFELPFSAACFLSVSLALAVIPPQAPGFVGVWQLAVTHALMAWGIDNGAASSFALFFWAVSFAPVTLIGIGCLWVEGLQLGKLVKDSTDALKG